MKYDMFQGLFEAHLCRIGMSPVFRNHIISLLIYDVMSVVIMSRLPFFSFALRTMSVLR